MPLEGIDNIHGGDSLPLGMLSVGDSVTDDILQEDLEDTPGFLVDESTDPFDAAPSCKSTDCRLGDALYNRISKDTQLKLTLPGCYLSTPCDAS